MTAVCTAHPPKVEAPSRSQLLVALDRHIAYHFGMAASAFPASLIASIVEELPGIEALTDPGWQSVIMRRLSINETHFLRQAEHFTLLERMARAHGERGENRPFRAWSAACSTGEEVWSMVHALRSAGLSALDTEVFGTDLNPDVVEKARAGRYRRWSMRGVADGSTAAWLAEEQGEFIVRDELRDYARFEKRNLMSTPYPGGWDVIFLRNVMIYLRPESVQQICQAAFDALRPGGALFIAATDPTPNAAIGFEEVYVGACRFYRRPEQGVSADPMPRSLRALRPAREADTETAPPRSRRPSRRRESASDAARRARAQRIAEWSKSRQAVKAPAPVNEPAPAARRASVVEPPKPVQTAPVGPPSNSAAAELVELSRGGRRRRALALLSDLVEERPSDVHVRLAMAEVAFDLGLMSIAIDNARQAFFLKPDDLMPNFWVGVSLSRSGQTPFGRARLRKAARLLAAMSPTATVPLSGGWTVSDLKRRLDDAARS